MKTRILSTTRLMATLPVIDNYFYRQIHQPLSKQGKKVLPGIVKYKQSIFDIYEFSNKQRILLQKIPEVLSINGYYFHAPKYLPEYNDVLLLLDKGIINSYCSGFELEASSFNYFYDLLDFALPNYSVYFAYSNEKQYYKVEPSEFTRLWSYYSRGSVKATNVTTVVCRKTGSHSVFDSTWTQISQPIVYKTRPGKTKSKSYIELSIFKAIDCDSLNKEHYERYSEAYSNELLYYKHYDHIDKIKFSSVESFVALLNKKSYKRVPKTKKTTEQYYISHVLRSQANYTDHYAKTYSRHGRYYTLNWFIMSDGSILRLLMKRVS